MTYDVVFIGGGHNGLTAAAYLARSGRRVLVLERSDQLGGAVADSVDAAGLRTPTLAHHASLLPEVIRDLDLERHGLTRIPLDPWVFLPTPDGRALTLWRDPDRAAGEIARWSSRDGERYLEFRSFVGRIAPAIRRILLTTPPGPRVEGLPDLKGMLGVGWELGTMNARDRVELLRIAPMCAADFLAEWFETDVVRAAFASRALSGTMAGPWSAGTTATLLMDLALHRGEDPGGPWTARGGIGRVVEALARAVRASGGELRAAACVSRVLVQDGVARGVELADGEQIGARLVVSNADPIRTLSGLVGARALEPKVLEALGAYRCRGMVSKVNLVLEGLPEFTAAPGPGPAAHHRGLIQIGHGIDYLERAFDDAKYGRMSLEPLLEATIPTAIDPATAANGRHVMSVQVRFTPFDLREGAWADRRETLAGRVLETLGRYAPGLPDSVRRREVVTPHDLQERHALTGGHDHHGEACLEQLYAMRPLPGYARYRTPIRNLYLCGAGTHPGGGVTGACGYNSARQILVDWDRGQIL